MASTDKTPNTTEPICDATPSRDSTHSPMILTVVQPKCGYQREMPIRKLIKFVPQGNKPNWDNEVGKNGQYKKDGSNPPPKYYRSFEEPVADLGDLADGLRHMHAQPEWAIALGQVIAKHREKENELQNFRRIRKNFNDVPSSLFMVDIDGFDLGAIDADFDMRVAAVELSDFEQAIEKMVAAQFSAAFHDCSLVAEMTSSAPLKAQTNPSLLYARLWFKMAVPLKTCQMKVLAESINTQAGVDDFLDCSIYAPEHLLYTANAKITAPVKRDGKIEHEPVSYPFERVVRYIELSEGEVTLPEQPVEIPAKATLQNGYTLAEVANRYSTSESASDAELWACIRPGGTHIPLVRLIGRYATRTPNHRTQSEKKKFKEMLLAKLVEISADENDFQIRCNEHLPKIDKGWHETVTEYKYKNFQQTDKRAEKHRDNLEGSRTKLRVYMQEQERLAVAYNPIQSLGEVDVLGSKGEASVKIKAQHSVYQVTPGVGKSTTRMKLIEPRLLLDTRTDWFSPNHNLSKQAAADMRAILAPKLGMTKDEIAELVRVHYGRQQKGMCINQTFDKLARDVEEFGGSAWKSVCKTACPNCGQCRYSKQREDVGNGVVIRAHAALYSAYRGLSPFVADEDGNEQRNPRLPARVVVDESILSVALAGADAGRYSCSERAVDDLALADSDEMPLIQREGVAGVNEAGAVWGDVRDEQRGAQLVRLRGRLVDLLSNAGIPNLMAGLVRFNLEQITSALELETAHRRTVGAMLRQLQKQAQAPANKSAAKLFERRIGELQETFTASLLATKIWQLLSIVRKAPQRERVAGIRLKDVGGKRYVTVLQVKKLPKVLSYIPTEWLDGTGNERLTRALLGNHPNVVFRTVDAEPRNYHLTQIADKSFATSGLVPRAEQDEEGKQERKRRSDSAVERLHRFIIHIAGEHNSVAVIAAKSVREALEPYLPDNVSCLHFGALRGQNEHKAVDALIVIGRSSPHYETLEHMVEGLFWNDGDVGDLSLADTWPRGVVEIERADGSIVDIFGERHSDELVELMRRQVVDAEVEQAIGRTRLVMRKADKHCSVFYLGQANAGVPVHQLYNFVDADFNLAEIALGVGVVFKKAESLAKAWPMLMPKEPSWQRKKARDVWEHVEGEECNLGVSSYNRNYTIRDNTQNRTVLSLAEFRLTAPNPKTGKKPFRQQAFVDPHRYPDPVAAISSLLGESIEFLGWKREGQQVPG